MVGRIRMPNSGTVRLLSPRVAITTAIPRASRTGKQIPMPIVTLAVTESPLECADLDIWLGASIATEELLKGEAEDDCVVSDVVENINVVLLAPLTICASAMRYVPSFRVWHSRSLTDRLVAVLTTIRITTATRP